MAEDAGSVGHRGVLVFHLGELVFAVTGAAESACGIGNQHFSPFRPVGIVAFATGAILDRLVNNGAVPGLVASHAHLRFLGNRFESVVARLIVFVAGEAFVLDCGPMHNLAILDLGVADRGAAGFGLLIGFLHCGSGGRTGQVSRTNQKHLKQNYRRTSNGDARYPASKRCAEESGAWAIPTHNRQSASFETI